MFRFKDLKILLLLLLFSFVGQTAWAAWPWEQPYSWFNFDVYVKAKVKTKDGIVYDYPEAGHVYAKLAKNSAEKENHDYLHSHPDWPSNVQSFDQSTTLHATANAGFKFLYWTKEDGSIINASTSEQENGKATVTSTATRRCYYGVNGSSDSNHAASHNSLIEQYGTYSNIFNYYAVFEPIKASIAVKSNNINIGRAICSKYDNKKDDVVTIKAYCVDYDTKFLGWEVNGEIISRENPYTFTVTNEASDEPIIYTAVFENGYNFHRIRNYVTKNYLNAISDDGNTSTLVSGGAITSLELNTNDLNDVMYEAGSIVDIYYARIPNDTRYYYDYFVQGAKASRYYDFDPDDPTSSTGGVFLRMPFDAKTYTNTWAFATANEGGFRFTDDNGTPKITMGERPESQWYIECVDKDLETCENYFSLDPAKLVEVDDKYYTTLRTSWNILFNPEQMTPYVVTEVDEVNGTFDMEPITGNIIPSNTPVIIETKSTDIEENRMVPTTTPFAGTKPEPNKLETSEKYFPNQAAPVSNCKGLIKNANGQLAFGGNALSTVNGNEAYLSVANEVVHDVQPVLTETTLANLLENGDIGPNYKITDLTCVYIQGNTLYCKDDNNALNKSVIAEGEEDYIKTYTALQDGDWDQSNWIAINLPEGSSIGTDYMEAIFDHRLNNVVGRLKSKVNPEFDASLMPTAGEKNTYDENTYITCNFSGEHQPGVVNGEDVNLFFVAPKPMEIAQVEWAMWDEESGMFVIPSNAIASQLTGAFLPNFSMLENISDPNPQDGDSYHFPALIKLTEASPQGSAPILAASNSSKWTVYPLEWNNTSIITAIDNLQAGKNVTSVVYYNMMGVASDKPHQGINIVETRYSDGSRTVEKVMK